MTRFSRSDPLQVQVLAALTSGAFTVADVATRVGRPEAVVEQILDGAVAEQLVTRLDLADEASYSLTPQGLEAVGVYQGVQGAVDDAGHVDFAAATRMVMEQYAAARDVATRVALRDQAGWPADPATRDRVSMALADAYARGALTPDQLDDRTTRALTAGTMGELRAAADGVLELPPVLPTGVGPVSSAGRTSVALNPALSSVRWRSVASAAGLAVLGLFLMAHQPLVGLPVLFLGIALGGYTLRPLLRTANVKSWTG